MGKAQKQSRRELVDKMQREQARAARRRTVIIVAVAVLVSLGIVAYPAYKVVQDSRTRNTPVTDLGVAAAQASCGDVSEDRTGGSQDHRPDGTKIQYPVSPPSSGAHYQRWAPSNRKFYTTKDRPALGNLVHNLEHGYTILWYSDAIGAEKEKVQLIERIAKTFSAADRQAGKLIAAPYTATDGGAPWPAGKQIAFTHWGGGEPQAQKGYRQFCGDISGEALKQFMDQHPATDSPEPNAG